MKKIIVTVIAFITFINIGFPQWELRDTSEFQPRNGLPNFFYKIKNNKCVNIGFIGGSITVANGWRPKIVSWLKQYYQIDSLNDYSAAIGGTNSKFGAFRIERYLLSKYDFDLIFVEFAVNDGSGNSADIEKSMEGIVRKIWKYNPHTDIFFVYTVSPSNFTDIEHGKMNLSASKHDSIASYYGIPSTFLGIEVIKLLQTDSVLWFDKITKTVTSQNTFGQYVFTTDSLHPSNFGHQIYADVISRSFKKMDNPDFTAHSLKSSIFKNNYENSKMLQLSHESNHGMEIIDSIGERDYLDGFLNNSKLLLVSDDTSTFYSFAFAGSEFGLDIITGPSCGKYIIEIDGIKGEYAAFNGYSSVWRNSSIFIKSRGDGVHFVKVYPSINKLSLSEKREILNSQSQKKDLDNFPEKYDKNELILSNVLLVGELTNQSTNNAINFENEFLIYPNPARDCIYIQQTIPADAEQVLTITTLTGEIKYNKKLGASDKLTKIDICKLTPGVYFLTVQNSKIYKTMKVLKY
jgi:hypothetical protein